ncbi:MAG TPA: ABC transporter substrate-binding protein [Candidatus Binatia bacterium]|jgi:phospholipid transport system substrate-binding protein|nr:ABC transporter substrate-binding protein [Candidatus Binatia bacterium]
MRQPLATALVLLLAAAPVLGAAPGERVRQTIDSVTATLNDPALQGPSKEEERRARIGRVMHDSFDFETMAQTALGTHWDALTAEQRARFVTLFGDLFERSYDRLVLRFLGGSTTTYGAEAVDGDRAVVRTTLVRKSDDELPVDYRLVSTGGAWKMSDVAVDGVSLAGNFRAQFDKTIRSESYDALVKRIEAKLAEAK